MNYTHSLEGHLSKAFGASSGQRTDENYRELTGLQIESGDIKRFEEFQLMNLPQDVSVDALEESARDYFSGLGYQELQPNSLYFIKDTMHLQVVITGPDQDLRSALVSVSP